MGDTIIKLALWHTKTFTPIVTHEELEPIMASLGFAPVKTNLCTAMDDRSASTETLWREYCYSSSSPYKRCWDPPLPKLPYPVIDGLHLSTYQVFLDSINLYLRFGDDLSDIIHVRGMTLNKLQDKSAKWSLMDQGDTGKINTYVYRDGFHDMSDANKTDVKSRTNKYKGHNRNIFRKGNNILAGCKFVPMEDVVVQRLTHPRSKKYKAGEQYTTPD